MDFKNIRSRLFALSAGVIVLYHLPLIAKGDEVFICVFDNLDSIFTHSKLLIESNTVFASSDTIIPQLNMPRIVLGSEFNLMVLLNYLLSPLYAHMAGFAITHAVAFIGMYLLLRGHFITEDKNDYINILVALCFSLLPFLPIGGISVAGQPLALFAFLNFRNRKHSFKDWLILLLVPFYSSLIFTFVFFLAVMGAIWLHDLTRKRDYNPAFLLSILFMSLIFICVEYRLFLFQHKPFFISHRYEFGIHHVNNLNLPGMIHRAFIHFILGSHIPHAPSLQKLSIGFALVLTLATFILSSKSRPLLRQPFYLLVGTTLLISVYYGAYNTSMALKIKNAVPLVRIFDFSRFDWLAPMLWHLIFALSLLFITKALSRFGRPLAYAFVAGQIIFCFYMSDFAVEMRQSSITFKQFFAEEQFREIGEYIEEPKDTYRVISIGMHPSISLFNGFNTADFYLSNYPLEYKHRFRKIIAKEIEKDPALKQYYDEWGSRVYAFTADLKRDFIGATTSTPIRELDYDKKAMRELGVRYVISRVPIEEPFIFMKRFSHPDSAWDIHLYRVSAD